MSVHEVVIEDEVSPWKGQAPYKAIVNDTGKSFATASAECFTLSMGERLLRHYMQCAEVEAGGWVKLVDDGPHGGDTLIHWQYDGQEWTRVIDLAKNF